MISRIRCMVFDGAANVACGTLTLGVPRLWVALKLPTSARRPAGLAMVTDGVAMLGTAAVASCDGAPKRARELLAASSVGNFIWAGLGMMALWGDGVEAEVNSELGEVGIAGVGSPLHGSSAPGRVLMASEDQRDRARLARRLVVSSVALYDGAMGIAKLATR